MVNFLKRLLFFTVMLLELPFTFVNLILVNVICLIYLLKLRTLDKAVDRAKKLNRTLEKLEGKVEWKPRKRI